MIGFLKYQIFSFSDLGKNHRPDKLIVHIGPKTHCNDTRQMYQIEPFSLKQDETNETVLVPNNRVKSDFYTVNKNNENLKSTKLVLQANDKATNNFPGTTLNNTPNVLHAFPVVEYKINNFEENFAKNKTEINSRTFLENVVAKPIESFINKSQSYNDSTITNNMRASSNVFKSNSFPCSSKMTSNTTFPSYRRSYLIAIGAENEVHKHLNTKTYPRRKDRTEMNVKLLELNKELPPRSPSKQFLSISFDNIMDGRLLKNNDLTEPSPLIVPLSNTKPSFNDRPIQSSQLNEKKLTDYSSTGVGTRSSRKDIRRLSYGKCPTDFDVCSRSNRISYDSDTSTESSLVFESHRPSLNKILNNAKPPTHRLNNLIEHDIRSFNKPCDKKGTVQNDLIPSVLSDLDNLSKSIDEEIFDIPNKVKRRPSILDDDIYCLETDERDLNKTRRHKHCYKCNYDKNNANVENEFKYTKRLSNVNVKSRVNSLKIKSDEEYRKNSIKQITSSSSHLEGLKSKINCKKKADIKKIKSIEDLKINRLIDTINKNCQNSTQTPTGKNHVNNSISTKRTTLHSSRYTTDLLGKTTNSKDFADEYLKSAEMKLELMDETLSNELERLTNEFKKNISTESSKKYEKSALSNVLSESEIYDLMHSDKIDKSIDNFNLNSLETNSEPFHTHRNISETNQFENSSVSQTSCDNFKHDFNNSKFKLINGKSSKLICDTPAHKKDSLRSSLLRNRKPSPFSPADDGELSDDSLKADEEVRKLLRQTEEQNNTEVQQWNGASSHSITTNQSVTSITSNQTNTQISAARTNTVKGGVSDSIYLI